VTSHVHYYSTHQLLTRALFLLLQFKLDAFRGHCQSLFMSGSLVILPSVNGCECDQVTSDWSFEPDHISIDKTGLWRPGVLLKWARVCWDEWPSHSTTTSLLKWIMNNPTGKLTLVDGEDGLSAFFLRSPWPCVDLILLGIQHLHHFADHSYHYWCCCGRATVKKEA
jgi:hypothetical protein